MEVITKEQFEAAKDMKPVLKEGAQIKELTEEEFNKHVEELDLPHRQFFFADQETIPLIKKQHNALEKIMSDNQLNQGGLVPMMIKSTHVALFGVYKLE